MSITNQTVYKLLIAFFFLTFLEGKYLQTLQRYKMEHCRMPLCNSSIICQRIHFFICNFSIGVPLSSHLSSHSSVLMTFSVLFIMARQYDNVTVLHYVSTFLGMFSLFLFFCVCGRCIITLKKSAPHFNSMNVRALVLKNFCAG